MNQDQASSLPKTQDHHHDHDHDHDHSHDLGEWKELLPAVLSAFLLLLGLGIDHYFHWSFFQGQIRLLWYGFAYLLVGWPVIQSAWKAIRKGAFFTEFSLMALATVGAFGIGEYPEGVAVMLFYTIGELLQGAAVQKAKNNITALLDMRPKLARVYRGQVFQEVHPEEIEIGETIQVRVGEQIPLDGQLLSPQANLNTAALSGESRAQRLYEGEQVLAGSINLDGVIEVKVAHLFTDSSIARILEMVQDASSKKAKTELLIRKYAKIYTPIVFYLALALTFLPFFFVEDYVFNDWLYRALVFLVISCPCALVISIPLGYFGGLGAASKQGILFKGANYLDLMTKVNTLVMDKTGTMTQGVFGVKTLQTAAAFSEAVFLKHLLAIEAKSTHPIAKAILAEYPEQSLSEATAVKEWGGKGLEGLVDGQSVLAGNAALMEQFGIEVPVEVKHSADTQVLLAVDGQWAGYLSLADRLKEDAESSVAALREAGVQQLIMLSGDQDAVTQSVAQQLNLDSAKGGLLPAGKLQEVERLKQDPANIIAFLGDGINDAPVLAASSIGIAMGGLGSDVAIETADVVIQTDQPSKVATAIKIGKATNRIILQNIFLAFGVKGLVLILGAMGMASMWGAVFADVGVALLAILNAVRLLREEY